MGLCYNLKDEFIANLPKFVITLIDQNLIEYKDTVYKLIYFKILIKILLVKQKS